MVGESPRGNQCLHKKKKQKVLKHLPPCQKTKKMGEVKAKPSVIEEIIKIREGANKTEAKKKNPLPKSIK